MVIIKRGKKNKTVTEGAYKNFYQRQGWKPVGEAIQVAELGGKQTLEDADSGQTGQQPKNTTQLQQDDQGSDEDNEDNEYSRDDTLTDEELLEIPVADMTQPQLKRAAEVIQYDYKAEGIKKIKALREVMAKKLAAR